MIKLIIFDLDGVLIESKDTHFDALNLALKDYGIDEISYDDHVSTFDGKPTKIKLDILGVDKSIVEDISNKKQDYTIELLENSIQESSRLIDIFKSLKNKGYKIAVASNSIRYTVQIILLKLGIMKYVDHVMSNEDVTNGKPNAEMYLKCMIKCGVGPIETLILEDSYVGREGAYNSGANLCPIESIDQVTEEHIYKYIQISNLNKNAWDGNDMNVLIPMAGAGSRFATAGYTFPKPLIEINGKPMIQVVVENLNIKANYTYIVQKEHYDKYHLKYMLDVITPGCNIVCVDGVTEGAACTTLLAKEFIDNDKQLIIANSDQFVQWDSSKFMYAMQGPWSDGGILTFKSTHPKWSYIKTGYRGYITEVKEKMVISDQATVGIYFWKKGSDYVKYAEQMIDKDVRVNGEFYVAPVYNEAIADGKKFKPYVVDGMYGLGTPEDLETFLKANVYDHK